MIICGQKDMWTYHIITILHYTILHYIMLYYIMDGRKKTVWGSQLAHGRRRGKGNPHQKHQ